MIETKFVNEIMNKYQPLTKEQEKSATLEELILHNVQFALPYAYKYAPKFLTPEEIVSEMFLALTRAANVFDRSKDVKFITYAAWHLRLRFINEVYDEQTDIRVNCGQRGNEQKVTQYISDFIEKFGYTPSDKIIAEDLKISETTVKSVRLYKVNGINSIFEKINDEDVYLKDIIPSGTLDPSEEAMFNEVYESFTDDNNLLTDIEKNLIYDRYILNQNVSSLAKKYKLNHTKVKSYIDEGLKKLKSVYED